MKKQNQFQINNEIEELITEHDAQGLSYSNFTKNLISQYSGSGGQGKHGAKGEGILYEFYTPQYVCELM